MEPPKDGLPGITRRHFFQQGGFGIGGLALLALLEPALFRSRSAAADPLTARPPHFAPKAKNVIFLFMAGGPSQVDLFDPKPKLNAHDGEKIPEEVVKGERFAFIKGVPTLLGSPYAFRRHGQTGAQVSSLLPNLARVVDDILILRSVHTDHFNHAPAQIFMNSGHPLVGRPRMGSWLTYGIGSESTDLPGFVVLLSGRPDPGAGSRLNERHFLDVGDPEIEARIAAYEKAYRMQTSVPELTDIAREPRSVHAMYGTRPGEASFANNCLLARRLVERGVRFVQLYHRGWDHHGGEDADISTGLPRLCRETDQAAAALIRDLKHRGLLDQTLVIWGGEFGRTPMNERGGDHRSPAVTITRAPSLCGWRAAVSRPAPRWARRTSSGTASPRIRCTCTTSTRRFST